MSGEVLLCEELTPSEAHLIEEASQDGKDTWLNGVFMHSREEQLTLMLMPTTT